MTTIQAFKAAVACQDGPRVAELTKVLADKGLTNRDCFRLALAADPELTYESFWALLEAGVEADQLALYNEMVDQAQELVEQGDIPSARRLYARAEKVR